MMKVQAVEGVMHPVLRTLQKQKEFLMTSRPNSTSKNHFVALDRLDEELRILH